MSKLIDVDTLPVLDVWGEAVRARRVEGERVTLALVELAPDAVVPGHRHENEQLGMVITGSVTFTIGDETRQLGPGGTWCIPSDTPHQVKVGPDGAVVIDIFAPIRADWDGLPSQPARQPIWPPRV
jgi:quercetin dioxygenase-like cupin family protein